MLGNIPSFSSKGCFDGDEFLWKQSEKNHFIKKTIPRILVPNMPNSNKTKKPPGRFYEMNIQTSECSKPGSKNTDIFFGDSYRCEYMSDHLVGAFNKTIQPWCNYFTINWCKSPKNLCPNPKHPKSCKFLVSRCLETLKNRTSRDLWDFEHLLTRYLDV